MSVHTFTRVEKDGIHVIFPTEGPKKQNCLLVNESVQTVFEQLEAGRELDEIRDHYRERARQRWEADVRAWEARQAEVERQRAEAQAQAQASAEDGEAPAPPAPPSPLAEPRPKEPDPRRVDFDLYRVLLMFKEHGICTFPYEDLRTLLPQGTALRGATQIMPVSCIPEVSAFLTDAIGAREHTRLFFAVPHPESMHPFYFEETQITNRHLGQQEVYFVHLDDAGEVEAVTVLVGFAAQPQSLSATLIATRKLDDEPFRDAVGSHFARVCGLLSIVTLSAMVRLQLPLGDDADVYTDPCFMDLLGDLEFRRSFHLPDEIGPGAGIVAYDKVLV